jgi:hypothetical protein
VGSVPGTALGSALGPTPLSTRFGTSVQYSRLVLNSTRSSTEQSSESLVYKLGPAWRRTADRTRPALREALGAILGWPLGMVLERHWEQR